MTLKRHLKAGIRLVIEADGNFTTLIIRASKGQLIKILDVILPDEPAGTKFSLRDEK
jgi:hypothetical protein